MANADESERNIRYLKRLRQLGAQLPETRKVAEALRQGQSIAAHRPFLDHLAGNLALFRDYLSHAGDEEGRAALETRERLRERITKLSLGFSGRKSDILASLDALFAAKGAIIAHANNPANESIRREWHWHMQSEYPAGIVPRFSEAEIGGTTLPDGKIDVSPVGVIRQRRRKDGKPEAYYIHPSEIVEHELVHRDLLRVLPRVDSLSSVVLHELLAAEKSPKIPIWHIGISRDQLLDAAREKVYAAAREGPDQPVDLVEKQMRIHAHEIAYEVAKDMRDAGFSAHDIRAHIDRLAKRRATGRQEIAPSELAKLVSFSPFFSDLLRIVDPSDVQRLAYDNEFKGWEYNQFVRRMHAARVKYGYDHVAAVMKRIKSLPHQAGVDDMTNFLDIAMRLHKWPKRGKRYLLKREIAEGEKAARAAKPMEFPARTSAAASRSRGKSVDSRFHKAAFTTLDEFPRDKKKPGEAK